MIFREIRELFRFLWRTPKEDKAIIFYSEHEGYYPNFEGIINELIGKHEQTLCYVTSDPSDPVLQTPEPNIKPFYLNKLLPFFMTRIDCKVFAMTMTDLNLFHIRRSANPVHYFYIFHSLVSTHMMYLREAFDHYDTIFCTGPRHVKEIRRQEELSGLPAKNLVEAGYYRLERIYEKHKKCERREISAHSKPTILVAPSWGDENLLESCGERLVEILIEAGYEVIVRPHPETVRRSPDLIKALRSRFEDSPDFTLETSVVTDDSLLRADALICDCSGIALEFAFGVERPVLFVDVPLKIRNPKYEELGIEPLELELRPQIGKIITTRQLDAVPRILSEFLDETAAREERLAELREQNVFAFGRSSEIGAGCIVDYLKSRR